MVGGDYLITRVGHLGSNSLVPNEKRASAFGRLSYELSPAITLFGQMAYSRYEGQSFYQQTPSTGVVIKADNAYVPAAFKATLAANTMSSFTIGTSNAGIPAAGSDNIREVSRYVIGANGGFGLIGKEWTWDAYYQLGVSKTKEGLTNTWNNARMALAQDAVVAGAGNAAGIAAGTIVCRSTLTSPTNGCVPINRIGVGGITDAALSYIFNGGNEPLRAQTLKQDVAEFNIATNELFDNWAGPVSLAFGGGYRKESVTGSVDPQFNSGWLYGNYLVTAGSYNVKEIYGETVFPVFEGMDFNGAVRLTDYSTSGRVTTWKAGLTWQIIEDLKLRGTVSRDIRAPNLGELFAPGTARTNTVNVPLPGGTQRTDQFTEKTTGNPLLNPEVAKTYGVGAVFTPRFLPGFAASADFYDIKLAGAIGTVTAQTTTTLCYEQSNAAFCNNIQTDSSGRITGITLIPFNFAAQTLRGIDLEASYRVAVGPGNLSLRALATHYISNKTDNGIDFPFEGAGVNFGTSATPNWNYRLTANYDLEHLGFNLTGRGLSGGVYDNSYIECQTGCPVSTVKNRTINNNHIAGAFYLDASATYRFAMRSAKLEAFVAIRNLLNTDPVLVGNGPTGNNTPAYPQTNRNLYDTLGRVFRMGVRLAI
jgi:outer membrane receptor protein involved in Fe transport